MTKKPKLAIGQTWRQRAGSIAKISANENEELYPFQDQNGHTYTRNGKYLSDKEDSNFDLVEVIPSGFRLLMGEIWNFISFSNVEDKDSLRSFGP